MSAILESGIGYGGNTSDTEWNRIKDKYPFNPSAPQPPNTNIDITPVLKELKESRLTADDAEDAKRVFNQTIAEVKAARKQVSEFNPEPILIGGQHPVEKQFQTICNQMKEKNQSPESITTKPTIQEWERDNGFPEKKKSVDETKKIIENFRDKVANYPKCLTYEGSMVICVLLSLNPNPEVLVKNLPLEDQQIIQESVKGTMYNNFSYFYASFDNTKDFIFTFRMDPEDEFKIEKNFINTVAHPRQTDLKNYGNGEVPIEKDGNKIAVGGKIVLDKKGIKRLIGIDPLKRDASSVTEDEEYVQPRRQPVAGRNAYEIRADVLTLAVDFGMLNKMSEPEDIIALAKTFYSFVENKNKY